MAGIPTKIVPKRATKCDLANFGTVQKSYLNEQDYFENAITENENIKQSAWVRKYAETKIEAVFPCGFGSKQF
jgi:hypothetical protein